jgi:hypothetical protein
VAKPRDVHAQELLDAVHQKGRLDIYAYAESAWGPEPRALNDARVTGDDLVANRLARWTDAPRTTLELTPFGRYWMSEGGYFAYLKSDGARATGGGGRGESALDPEMRKELDFARLELMRRRLKTFWWGFGISIVSLCFSIVSLYLALTGKR